MISDIYIDTSKDNVYCKFLDRKTNMLTFSGFSEVRFEVTTLPLLLKGRSDGELVTQIHRYFFAILDKHGKSAQFNLHQSKGSDSESGVGLWKYFSTSRCTFPMESEQVSHFWPLHFYFFFRRAPSSLRFAGGGSDSALVVFS